MSALYLIMIFGVVVMITHFLEGITGFGCTVLAMPFSIMLLGLGTAKPVLSIYALILAAYIAIRYYKSISFKDFWKIILFTLIGLPIGIVLYDVLLKKADTQKWLLIILAVFMVAVSIRGLLINFNILKRKNPIKNPLAYFFVFLGGIIHGAFASGGPLVTIYATEKIKDKSVFRATLCLVWSTLNTILIIQMIAEKQIDMNIIKTALYAGPFFIAGLLLGDYSHKHIKDTVFTKLVFLVLLGSGIAMLVQNFVKL